MKKKEKIYRRIAINDETYQRLRKAKEKSGSNITWLVDRAVEIMLMKK